MEKDARLIYERSRHLASNVDWYKHSANKWVYCGIGDELQHEIITNDIYTFLGGDIFYVAATRNDSCIVTVESVLSTVFRKIGSTDFMVWSSRFNKVIEFNKIGVFRKGVCG
jgi:hypothetical protein